MNGILLNIRNWTKQIYNLIVTSGYCDNIGNADKPVSQLVKSNDTRLTRLDSLLSDVVATDHPALANIDTLVSSIGGGGISKVLSGSISASYGSSGTVSLSEPVDMYKSILITNQASGYSAYISTAVGFTFAASNTLIAGLWFIDASHLGYQVAKHVEYPSNPRPPTYHAPVQLNWQVIEFSGS